MNQALASPSHTRQSAADFVRALQAQLTEHPALHHPFLKRFAEASLTREQLGAYAVQHYMYSRFFTRNLAAVVSNVPDENARTMLILNMYEEIGEPHKLRDRAHLFLLEAGLVKPEQVIEAIAEVGSHGDITAWLIEHGVVPRQVVSGLMAGRVVEAKELTHPALFRRFLRALGITPDHVAAVEPLPETSAFIRTYEWVCRNGHWLQAMGAMGLGTECVVPSLYSYVLEGIVKSGVLTPEQYIFWTIHVTCDEGHGQNIIDAMAPFLDSRENQELVENGARRVLDARQRWFDGLERMLFPRPEPRAVAAP